MRNLLLLSAMAIMPVNVFAAPSQVIIHTTPIELTSISQIDQAYKIAAVCFLGFGCGDDARFTQSDNDLTINPAELCKQKGFMLTSCPLPKYLQKPCPDDAKYFAECVENKSRACDELGFVAVCAPGQVLDASQACPYDNSWQKCICNPCEGYDYTYAQATAEGYMADGSCISCSETKYKRKADTCEGFLSCECGGEIGTEVCLSGTEERFATCKACYIACPLGSIDVNNYWCGGGARCYVK